MAVTLYNRSRQATNVFGSVSLTLFRLSLSLSLSLSRSLSGSLHTHTLLFPQAQREIKRQADWMRARASWSSGTGDCKIRKLLKMTRPLLCQAKWWPKSCCMIQKRKKKKKEKKLPSAKIIVDRVTWDQVRPGTNQQCGPKSFVWIPNLYFSRSPQPTWKFAAGVLPRDS